MTTLSEQLREARALCRRLENAIAGGKCAEIGHAWVSLGGANCGCDGGQCSVPVHTCARCGDCDYGENKDADAVRGKCRSDLP